jgi:importin subunit alpha-1
MTYFRLFLYILIHKAVLDSKVLDKMPLLLSSSKNIKKDACWMLSNIAAGKISQIHAVCKKPIILAPLVAAIKSSEWEIRKEAIWAANNIAAGGNDSHVVSIVFFGAIEGLCENLGGPDTDIILTVLNTLENILKVGERQGKAYDCLVDEAGGVEKIENLQQHRCDAIYMKSRLIIEKYFHGEEPDIVDENIAPPSNGNSYTFCVPQKLFHEDNPETENEIKSLFANASKNN